LGEKSDLIKTDTLVTFPFAVVEVLERTTRLSGGLGNAIKYYGPRLADVSTHLLRASYGG